MLTEKLSGSLTEIINPTLELLARVGAKELTVDTANLALIGASRVQKYSPLFGRVGRFGLNIQEKGFDETLVTIADHSSQKLITHFIDRKYPGSSIVGEEETIIKGNNGLKWVFDPLDGTGIFVPGVGASVTTVMCSSDEKPAASAIIDPFQRSAIIAEKGRVWAVDLQGLKLEERKMNPVATLIKKRVCFWHDTTLRNTTADRIGKLLPALKEAFPKHNFAELSTGSNVNNQAALCRCGGDLQITWAVGGPWDILPGAFAIEQAGGIVTDLRGNPVTEETKDGMLSASNQEIHEKALTVVKQVFEGYQSFKLG